MRPAAEGAETHPIASGPPSAAASLSALLPGFDGDLAIVDPDERWAVRAEHLQSRAGWTPWEGRELRGRVKHTVLRGRLVFREGVFLGEPAGRPLRYL